ncbi:MAG: Uma2 family endonuclease [Chthoniobacteraceae bacterium]
MAKLSIELPVRTDQTKFNVQRWTELIADDELGRQLENIPGRIETDRHGYIIMQPPPGYSHGGYQFEIGSLLKDLLPHGRVSTESPVSTADGVKGIDVTWISRTRLEAIGEKECLTQAPEICVEVLSPSNTQREMAEKKTLLFAAAAREVWFCDGTGRMTFYTSPGSRGQKSSKLCPNFPRLVRL